MGLSWEIISLELLLPQALSMDMVIIMSIFLNILGILNFTEFIKVILGQVICFCMGKQEFLFLLLNKIFGNLVFVFIRFSFRSNLDWRTLPFCLCEYDQDR